MEKEEVTEGPLNLEEIYSTDKCQKWGLVDCHVSSKFTGYNFRGPKSLPSPYSRSPGLLPRVILEVPILPFHNLFLVTALEIMSFKTWLWDLE